mmetsp:Transcript_29693/g.34154  ORF Transcript_29693/g.34154 Transcript_29693/m.34154 type:complete len:380 (+) Transcript_29693:1465-2604(+)
MTKKSSTIHSNSNNNGNSNGNGNGNTFSTMHQQQQPRRTTHPSSSPTKQQTNHAHAHSHSPMISEQDIAKTDEEERKQIAQARIKSFRYLRGDADVDGVDHDHDDDGMTIPTFARPPRIIKHVKKTYNVAAKTPFKHLNSVQEGRATDLLDDDMLMNPSSSADFPSIGKSASSLTLDTLLKDVDNNHNNNENNTRQGTGVYTSQDDISIVTEQYSHLDPKQIWKTQQNLSFKLQSPPVFADTSAGDLMQSTNTNATAMGANNIYVTNQNSNQAGNIHTPYHQNQIPGQSFPHGYQNQVQNHFQMGFNHHATLQQQYNNNLAMQQQRQNHQQQQQQHHLNNTANNTTMRFVVPPPAPTWDTLNHAFASSPPSSNMQHQQT